MKKKKLTEAVKDEALQAVATYNEQNNTKYLLYFSGQFAYLDRIDKKVITKIGRLKYLHEEKSWDFAVFKYSREQYDPHEWMFPGQELLDGTIEGALRAGMKIYPPTRGLSFGSWGCNPVGCLLAIFLIPFLFIKNLLKKLLGR